MITILPFGKLASGSIVIDWCLILNSWGMGCRFGFVCYSSSVRGSASNRYLLLCRSPATKACLFQADVNVALTTIDFIEANINFLASTDHSSICDVSCGDIILLHNVTGGSLPPTCSVTSFVVTATIEQIAISGIIA